MASFSLGSWYIDSVKRVATRGRREVSLSDNEFELLAHLANAGGPVARQTLLEEVYGYAPGVQSRALDQGMLRLRTKLEDDPTKPVLILSRRAVGLYLDQVVLGSRQRLPPTGRGPLIEVLTSKLDTPGLLTLVGPAGIGKTVVAEHLTLCRTAHTARLPNPCSIEALEDVVATALGCTVDAIDGRLTSLLPEALLLLDGAEGLAPGAVTRVGRWSTSGGVVATSLRPLGVGLETVVTVPELDRDDAATVLTDAAGSALDPDQVDEMIGRVGGHPMALILLAPWASLGLDLPKKALLSLAPESGRGESLQALVERSTEALTEPARQALRGLSLFAEGFERHGAEAMLGPGWASTLAELARWGLVRRDGGRFHLLPLARWSAAHEAGDTRRQTYQTFIEDLGTLYLTVGAEPARAYNADLLRVATAHTGRFFDVALMAAQLDVPYDRLVALVLARERSSAEIALACMLARAGGLPEFPALKAELAAAPMDRALVLFETFSSGLPTQLSAALFRSACENSTPLERYLSLHTVVRNLPAEDRVALMHEALDLAVAQGWDHAAQWLRTMFALLDFRAGDFRACFEALRDRATDVHATSTIYQLVSAVELGLHGEAEAIADRLLARCRDVGDRPGEARSMYLKATVRFLRGETDTAMVERAHTLPGSGDGVGTAILGDRILKAAGRTVPERPALRMEAWSPMGRLLMHIEQTRA